MANSSFKSKNHTSNKILELFHVYLCRHITPQSYCSAKYFILFVDDYFKMMIVMYLKEKYKEFKMFKWYLARVEKETGKSLKCLRSDRGGEFISNEFEMFYNDKGIKRQTYAPRTPLHNGIVERRNRSIMDYAKTLMIEKNFL